MPTLTQIRINSKNKQKLELYNQINYKNPFMLTLILKTVKTQNINFIKKICEENNVSDNKKKELLDIFIKPNYYTPLVVNSTKEETQKI